MRHSLRLYKIWPFTKSSSQTSEGSCISLSPWPLHWPEWSGAAWLDTFVRSKTICQGARKTSLRLYKIWPFTKSSSQTSEGSCISLSPWLLHWSERKKDLSEAVQDMAFHKVIITNLRRRLYFLV